MVKVQLLNSQDRFNTKSNPAWLWIAKTNIFLSMFPKNAKFEFSPKIGKFDILGIFGEVKKCARQISRKTHRRMPRDLSYETDSGPKTKLKIDPFLDPLKKWTIF